MADNVPAETPVSVCIPSEIISGALETPLTPDQEAKLRKVATAFLNSSRNKGKKRKPCECPPCKLPDCTDLCGEAQRYLGLIGEVIDQNRNTGIPRDAGVVQIVGDAIDQYRHHQSG